MSITDLRAALGLALVSMLPGCSVYQDYGYGWLARSRLPADQATAVVLPADAPSISQRFHPHTGPSYSDHRGFDILVPTGTPVLAAGDGRVDRTASSLLYGRQVYVNHDHGAAGFRLQTRYFHLNETLVREDEAVRRGQLLGYSGATGLAAGYPHLHFEVHRLGEADPPLASKLLDPQLFWVDGEGRVTCYDGRRDYAESRARLTYPVPCRGFEWQP